MRVDRHGLLAVHPAGGILQGRQQLGQPGNPAAAHQRARAGQQRIEQIGQAAWRRRTGRAACSQACCCRASTRSTREIASVRPHRRPVAGFFEGDRFPQAAWPPRDRRPARRQVPCPCPSGHSAMPRQHSGASGSINAIARITNVASPPLHRAERPGSDGAPVLPAAPLAAHRRARGATTATTVPARSACSPCSGSTAIAYASDAGIPDLRRRPA